jgi:hypothetical protein
MRFLTAALCTTVAAALLASCSSTGSSNGSAIPGSAGAAGASKFIPLAHHGEILSTVPHDLIKHGKFRGKLAPGNPKGLYVQQFYSTSDNIIGFPKNNSGNGPPDCYLSTGSNVNDFGTDQKGDIIIPNAFSGVLVYAPPVVSGQCGTLLGTITDSAGQATSAAALDAANSTIVVGQIGGGTSTGVVTCTLASLNCTPLTSPNMSSLAGVAMDKSGNCYADAFDTNGKVGLWYYAGCSGTGTELTSANGFNEPYYGGISADNRGNIVTISLLNASDSTPSTVTVYSGCSTGTCTVVSGPTALQGESVFGHLGRQNERYATTDITDSMVEVYSYTPGGAGGVTYMYSFNNGLTCATNLCESAVYQPTSPK